MPRAGAIIVPVPKPGGCAMMRPDALPWSKTAAPIWEMVCGYESAVRRQQALFMLTAHFDDSWNEDVFVVAGFIATAEAWAAFSDEWSLILGSPRGIGKLVANDAMKMRGEFHGFSTEERDRKLDALARIINEYASLEVFCMLPVKSLNEEFKRTGLPKEAADPYYHAMLSVIHGIASQQIANGTIEEVHFIFDEKKKQEAQIYKAWGEVAESQTEEMRTIMGRTPTFDSDDKVLPLQAADWAAWHRREQGILKAEFHLNERPWRRVPAIGGFVPEGKIREAFAQIAEGYAKRSSGQ